MISHALRLLVALLTFAVGTAAAWLLNCKSAPASGGVKTVSVLVADEPPPPPPHSCSGDALRVSEMFFTSEVTLPAPAQVSGTVMVRVLVRDTGTAYKATAVSGPEPLREAAEKNALARRYSIKALKQPALIPGLITYNFVPE